MIALFQDIATKDETFMVRVKKKNHFYCSKES